jgi:chromosomal replication initiation ATPase DnaA
MSKREQMLLDLGHRSALGREDFLVSASNAEAVAFLDAWPDWQAVGLVVVGPKASGKTHLAEVWRGRSGAVRLAAADLEGREAPSLLDGGRNAVVEDADRGVDQESLLHLYNEIAERRGHLLLTACEPVARWGLTLADLRSRLLTLPSVSLGPADDELMQAVLVKLFADRQLRIDPDLVAYLAPRLERSLATVARAVELLDKAAMQAQARITLKLARDTLRPHNLID